MLSFCSSSLFILTLSAQATIKKPSKPKQVHGQFLIKFKQSFNNNAHQILQQQQLITLRKFQSIQSRLIEFQSSDKMSDQHRLNYLKSLPGVEYVEPNFIYRVNSLNQQSKILKNNKANHINSPRLWNDSSNIKEVIVAIIDSGVDYRHKDLQDSYWHNPGELGIDANGMDKRSNNIDDDENGYVDDFRGWDFINNDNDPMDNNGHGTHCAGTIVTTSKKHLSLAASNGKISIVGLKFLDHTGEGTLANAAAALEYAIKMGANVTNNSWGSDEYSQTLEDMIIIAAKNDTAFITAAGNVSSNNDLIDNYPANSKINNVLSVGAINKKNSVARFSNFGQKTVHLFATGTEILSTYPDNNYHRESGTSMAAPFVAAAWALIKVTYPKLTVSKIRKRILYSVKRSPELMQNSISGGRLNLTQALENDFDSPTLVKNIKIERLQATSLYLSWDKSHDTGETSTSSQYQVRFAKTPIKNNKQWDSASIMPLKIQDSNDKVQAIISSFSLNAKGYITIIAIDKVGNPSTFSNSIAISLAAAELKVSYQGDNLGAMKTNGGWGVQVIDGNSYFTDSPNGNYRARSKNYLELPAINLSGHSYILNLKSSYKLEAEYDFVTISLRSDFDRRWKELIKFTGDKASSIDNIDLSPYISTRATSFKIRFQLKADNTHHDDGILIDYINIFQSSL